LTQEDRVLSVEVSKPVNIITRKRHRELFVERRQLIANAHHRPLSVFGV
jgi:hypothetical protein